LERVGRTFRVPQLANMLEGGRTPMLPPKLLEEMGFRIAIYGISMLMHAVRAMEQVLGRLATGEVDFAGKGVDFETYKDIVGFNRWAEIETRFAPRA
jgi:2-methylisocitrate lyase-like PEP mutase family enzyme